MLVAGAAASWQALLCITERGVPAASWHSVEPTEVERSRTLSRESLLANSAADDLAAGSTSGGCPLPAKLCPELGGPAFGSSSRDSTTGLGAAAWLAATSESFTG